MPETKEAYCFGCRKLVQFVRLTRIKERQVYSCPEPSCGKTRELSITDLERDAAPVRKHGHNAS